MGFGGGGVSCFHGHLNKCPLGDLNKSPWENYLEGGGSKEIIKSTRFCKVHYVLNSDIKCLTALFPQNTKRCSVELSVSSFHYSGAHNLAVIFSRKIAWTGATEIRVKNGNLVHT